jgi:hypothetical protein
MLGFFVFASIAHAVNSYLIVAAIK